MLLSTPRGAAAAAVWPGRSRDRGGPGWRAVTFTLLGVAIVAVVVTLAGAVPVTWLAARASTGWLALLVLAGIGLRDLPWSWSWATRVADVLAWVLVVVSLVVVLVAFTGWATGVADSAVDAGTLLSVDGWPRPFASLLLAGLSVLVWGLDRVGPRADRVTGPVAAGVWVLAFLLAAQTVYTASILDALPDGPLLLVLAGMPSVWALLAATAAATARPRRPPLGPMLATGMWLVTVAGLVVIVVIASASALVHRSAEERLGIQAETLLPEGVAVFTGLVVLLLFATWYAAHLQARAEVRVAERESRRLARTVADGSSLAMTVLNLDGTIRSANTAYAAMCGCPADSIVGGSWDARVVDPVPFTQWAEPLIDGAVPVVQQERVYRRYGSADSDGGDEGTGAGLLRSTRVTVSTVHGGDGLPRALVEQVIDVTEQEAVAAALAYEATHDRVTGLMTRPEAEAWLAQTLTQSAPVWVCAVDIDRFRLVNDAFGHDVGDAALRNIADRLADATGPGGLVGRLGGDEFVAFAPLPDPARGLTRTVERVTGVFADDLDVAGVRLHLTGSVGVVLGGGDVPASTLVHQAITARDAAKAAGGNRHQYFDERLQNRARHRMQTRALVRDALAVDPARFAAWFQPVVDFADGNVVGYEALARWTEPGSDALPAGAWIEAVEDDPSIIHTLSLAMLADATRFAATLPPGKYVTVNVSGAHVTSPVFVEFVDAAVDTAQRLSDPGRLVVEVTETALARLSRPSISALTYLTARGVGLWVDDFGTGYSSMAHLRDLPVTGLKLDKSFTAGVTDPDSPAARIAAGLSGLAKGLDLVGVAEGVETVEQADRLRDVGWAYGQGFLYARPQPASAYAI